MRLGIHWSDKGLQMDGSNPFLIDYISGSAYEPNRPKSIYWQI